MLEWLRGTNYPVATLICMLCSMATAGAWGASLATWSRWPQTDYAGPIATIVFGVLSVLLFCVAILRDK